MSLDLAPMLESGGLPTAVGAMRLQCGTCVRCVVDVCRLVCGSVTSDKHYSLPRTSVQLFSSLMEYRGLPHTYIGEKWGWLFQLGEQSCVKTSIIVENLCRF